MLRTVVLTIAILVLCVGANAGVKSDSRVVMVVAGNMSIRDIIAPDLPYLEKLIESGSSALMNVRTGRPVKDIEPTVRPGMEAGCVSIGAGAMGVGGAEVRRASNAGGNLNGIFIGEIYESRMGRGYGTSRVLHTEIAKIQRINQSASYRARPGLLGTTLHKAGIKTAVLGNSDLPGEMHREAAAIAMDETGRVDYGDVDSPLLNLHTSDAPFGMRVNSEAYLNEFDQLPRNARFIVINFADTFRADSYGEFCTDEQAAIIRHKAAMGLDGLIARLIGRLDFSKDTLILLSPNYRNFSEIEDERLAPIVIKGPSFGSGILTSPSTHRNGVVTINDVAPTILSSLGVKQPIDMVGRSVSSAVNSDVSEALLNINMDASLQAQRQVVMRGASVAQSVVVILVTLIAILIAFRPLRKFAAWLALIPIMLPLAMLYMPLVYSGGLIGAIIFLVVATPAILALCSLIFKSPMCAFAWLCGITVLGLILDLVRGAPLTTSSIAGYSLVDGARYYGIGNELMGTLLGATIIGIALLSGKAFTKYRGIITAIIFAVVFVFIGSPSLGANLGGALAAAPAMVVMLLARRGWKPNARSIGIVLLVTFFLVGALFAIDSMRNGATQTHVGRVVDLVSGGDKSDVVQVVERKIMLNFMLLSTSLWSRLLGLSLVGSALLFWWGKRQFGAAFLNKEQSASALGCCIGVVGAFVFNDSGVVAAATCAVFLWMLLGLTILHPADIKKPEDRVIYPPV